MRLKPEGARPAPGPAQRQTSAFVVEIIVLGARLVMTGVVMVPVHVSSPRLVQGRVQRMMDAEAGAGQERGGQQEQSHREILPERAVGAKEAFDPFV